MTEAPGSLRVTTTETSPVLRTLEVEVDEARVRKMFEDKGQTWDPTKNSVQAQALNHHGRRSSGVVATRAK